VQLGPGDHRLLETVMPERLAYLGSQLVLARPEHRPWPQPGALAEAVGGRGQSRRTLWIARCEGQPRELDEDQADVAAVVGRQAQCQAVVEQHPGFIELAAR